MLGTPVPEAAIDEDEHSPSREGHIGPDRTEPFHPDRKLNAIAQPSPVKLSAQANLWSSSAPTVALHHRSNRRRACYGGCA